MNWTTPADLQGQVQRLWQQGKILRSLATNEPLFPRRLVLSGPSSSEMVSRFDDVRAWISSLRNASPCRIETRSFRHPELGNNAVPAAAWIDNLDDSVSMIGKQPEVARFAAILQSTRLRQPEWIAWLARKPLVALDLADHWDCFLDIACWCRAHPRPGLYLRQIDLPGVHTKFIEAHRGVLIELLDLALPEAAIDQDACGAARFNARYGFRDKPPRIRFRALDPTILPGWIGDDVTMQAAAFAKLELHVSKVFITENEINFLAFPPAPNSLIIFGGGYGFDVLHQAVWLTQCQVHYWGDIDTHGFAILDQLRHRFVHVSSLLMDHATFTAFRHLWGTEPAAINRELTMLTLAEKEMYNDLRDNKFGQNLRLEQEKIGFGTVEAALTEL